MYRFKIYFIILVVFVYPLSFAEGASKSEKLIRLAKYENVVEIVERYRSLCIKETMKVSPEKIFSETPTYFGGITPESKYWKDVKEIYESYITSTCSYLNEEKVLNKYILIYSEEMTDQALDGILSFYESAPGQDYLKAITVGNEKLQVYYAESARPAMERAMKVYAEELIKIIYKFKKDNGITKE